MCSSVSALTLALLRQLDGVALGCFQVPAAPNCQRLPSTVLLSMAAEAAPLGTPVQVDALQLQVGRGSWLCALRRL